MVYILIISRQEFGPGEPLCSHSKIIKLAVQSPDIAFSKSKSSEKKINDGFWKGQQQFLKHRCFVCHAQGLHYSEKDSDLFFSSLTRYSKCRTRAMIYEVYSQISLAHVVCDLSKQMARRAGNNH